MNELSWLDFAQYMVHTYWLLLINLVIAIVVVEYILLKIIEVLHYGYRKGYERYQRYARRPKAQRAGRESTRIPIVHL